MPLGVFLLVTLVAAKHRISYQTIALLIDLVPCEEPHWQVYFLQDFLWTNVDEIPLSIQPEVKYSYIVRMRENIIIDFTAVLDTHFFAC